MTTATRTLTWNLVGRDRAEIETVTEWADVAGGAEWAWGGSTGRGVRVCVLDSGVEAGHPAIGALASSHAVHRGEGDEGYRLVEDEEGDACGHGTACASVIRRLAPDCEVHSIRVLGSGFRGSGDALIAGVRWAVAQGYDVINMSLSTTRRKFAEALHEIADHAYFGRVLLVASAHNMPVESYPWRFSSVISVGSHDQEDPELLLYNPAPPVEFFAPGVEVPVAWTGGTTRRCTGNSFATPHVAGMCARILAKHPGFTPFQVKQALFLASENVRREHS
ncbi:S8 family serine peptidase [Streptomyces sp. HC44]|uniref:S8 family serine peptidase n=1 Tax=Streptomyces scabichelini TaxID=2711217 RepID=A0A6G4V6G4_9ACTN|nr:S8 family serine peptidase [Streptomyces scabichelini]NGO09430.1 S8 family serine peptidase [Streptomyces scabichelini]